jgi:hypothetical protein
VRRPIIHRLQFGLQFTAVRDRPERTDQGRWPRLKRSRRPRPELLMRLGYSANSAAQNPDFGGGRCTGRSAVRSRSPAPRPGGRGAAGRWGPFRGRTLVIWTACYLDCACALTLASIISPESAGGAVTRSAGSPWLFHQQKKMRMVKTRLGQWISRWRERRLARAQTRQTSATRQAARDAEAQRYHSTGHGP